MSNRIIDHVHNPIPTRKVMLEWIEDIEAGGRGVTPWEEGFVADVKGKLEKGWQLSEKECKVLERIYTERTN